MLEKQDNEIIDFKNHATQYIELRLTLIKLDVIEKTSILGATIASSFIIILLFSFIFLSLFL